MTRIRHIMMAFLLITLVGCTNSPQEPTSKNPKESPIKFGVVVGGPSTGMFEIAKKELEKEGWKIDIVEFNDFNTPNTALADGSIDFNFYQHIPFLNAYNQSHGTKLVPVGDGVYNVYYGVFSDKISDIKDVKPGMKISIQNDNANRSTSLYMLAEAGLIKMKEGLASPNLLDISENPHNLEFIEMDEPSIIANLSDVDLACVSCSRWVEAGKSMNEAILKVENKENIMTVATIEGKENSEEAQAIQKACTSQVVKTYMEEKYAGAVKPRF